MFSFEPERCIMEGFLTGFDFPRPSRGRSLAESCKSGSVDVKSVAEKA